MSNMKEKIITWIFFIWYLLSLYLAYNAGAKKYWNGANEAEFSILLPITLIMFIYLVINLDIKKRDR